MARRDSTRDRNLDDWFDEPDTAGLRPPAAAQPGESAEGGIDDWLSSGDFRARRGPRLGAGLSLSDRRVALAAVGIVALGLVIGLAAGGVFSGGRGTPATTAPLTTAARTASTPAKTTASQVPVPTAPLKPGDTGAQVKALQRALASLAYAPGAIDGQYGPSTVAAVKRFQQASGLTADGICGPATLRALDKALKGP